MISFANIRLMCTSVGVFLLMGAFISYLQAEKQGTLSANSFADQSVEKIQTVSVNLKPVKKDLVHAFEGADLVMDKIAIVHASSYPGLTITSLKKALLGGGYEHLLKADSKTGVTGTYVFARENDFAFFEFVLKPLVEATIPHTKDDIGFQNLSDYASFVADHGMQNTRLGSQYDYEFDSYMGVLYQNHTDLAATADYIVVIGDRGL